MKTKRVIGLLLVALSWTVSFADQVSVHQRQENISAIDSKSWLIESAFQVHSVTSGSDIMFGPALTYGLSGRNSIGARALLAVQKAGAYTFSGIYRHAFSERRGRVFLEPSISVSLLNPPAESAATEVVPSLGASTGFQYAVNEDLNILASAGLEGYWADESSSVVFQVGSVYVSPKASVAIAVGF